MTSASACWSSVSGPGRSRYRLRAPRRTAPTWSGKPKTARTPASMAGPVKASHRGVPVIGQIGFEHGPVLVVGVHAGPLAERVLQLLDEVAHLVGGAHRTSGHVAGHQHDPRAAHAGDLGAHLAQPLRLQLGSPAADEPGEDPQTPFARHRSRSPATGHVRGALIRPMVVRRPTTPSRHRRGDGDRTAGAAGLQRGRVGVLVDSIDGWYRHPRAQRTSGSVMGVASTGRGSMRSARPHRSRIRRAHLEGDRSTNDRDRSPRSSRARTMTPTVAAPMNCTPLRSTTRSASSSAIARARVSDSAATVDDVVLAAKPHDSAAASRRANASRPRRETVTDKTRWEPWHSPGIRRCE